MADKSTEEAQEQTAREATDAATRFRGAGTVKTADALQTPRAPAAALDWRSPPHGQLGELDCLGQDPIRRRTGVAHLQLEEVPG
jgi:hypothetical protein